MFNTVTVYCCIAGQCVSGFPSLDRIDAVLNYGDITQFPGNEQAIIPSTNFICDGSIHSWVFGGQWGGSTDSLTELQIWRSGDQDGVHNKVGSTIINVTEGELNQRKLYHCNLSSPLPFQAGDILGYYRSGRHVNLIYENVGSGHLFYFSVINHALSQYDIRLRSGSTAAYHVLIGITTGEVRNIVSELTCEVCQTLYRFSRLCEWFHECGENETTTRNWKCYHYRPASTDHTRYEVHM